MRKCGNVTVALTIHALIGPQMGSDITSMTDRQTDGRTRVIWIKYWWPTWKLKLWFSICDQAMPGLYELSSMVEYFHLGVHTSTYSSFSHYKPSSMSLSQNKSPVRVIQVITWQFMQHTQEVRKWCCSGCQHLPTRLNFISCVDR